jgi:small-conductance mechanosensitive channel
MTEWVMEAFARSETEAKLILSVGLVFLLVSLRIVLARLVARGVDDTHVIYRVRKTLSYVLALIGLLLLLWLWVGALRNLGTFLGLAVGGMAIALADVLRNIAGWAYLLLRRPYRVDDRIEVDGVIGDVIDIRVFRTTLLEIGNWVDADQSTGRIVHVPNGRVFQAHVFNATEGFGYIWHELPLYITAESDWRRAEQLLQAALDEAGAHTAEQATRRIQQASRYYKIQFTHLTPTVYVSVRDGRVLLTGRILVDTRRRRAVDQQVWRNVLDAIREEPTVEMAYPTTRTYFRDPLQLEMDERTASSVTDRRP